MLQIGWMVTSFSLTSSVYVAFNVPQNIVCDVRKRITSYFELLPTPSNSQNKNKHDKKFKFHPKIILFMELFNEIFSLAGLTSVQNKQIDQFIIEHKANNFFAYHFGNCVECECR